MIVANRFLAGTRAFVSFFAGMSKMSLPVTTLLSALSAAVWNSILLYLGMVFANNWRVGAEYLALYSKVATAVFGAALVVFLWWFFRKRRKIEDRGSRIEDRESKIGVKNRPPHNAILDPLASILAILYPQSSILNPQSNDILIYGHLEKAESPRGDSTPTHCSTRRRRRPDDRRRVENSRSGWRESPC